ncbi:MAG: hypothetical protein AB1757_07620 [Acidobacteriota bacterium]
MKDSARYLKIVEWSDEDSCYIGRCPSLMLGGVHGNDELKVYTELCKAVDEWIDILKAEGQPLPEPTSRYVYKKPLRRHSGKQSKVAPRH